MDFFYSLTSPYARVVRMALIEKEQNEAVRHHVVNPGTMHLSWSG